MAPPNNINPAFLKGFVKYNAAMTEPQTGKQRTYTEYRPKPGTGYDILTDDALNSGNLKVLTDFSKAHEKARRRVGDTDEARGKIANLLGSLSQKQNNGKSCFENLLYTMNDSTRRA